MFKKWLNAILMKPNIYPNLNDQQQFRLNIINEIKDYFVAKIKERELISKRLSKYIASFDYFDKSLIALYVTSSSIFIASFATVSCYLSTCTNSKGKFYSCIFNSFRNCKKTVKDNKKQEEKA